MGFSRHRKLSPWEVVDHRVVRPVTAYLSDDDELEIIHVGLMDMRGTYLFDVKDDAQYAQRALVFARHQLLLETLKRGYNALLLEGWEVTTLRRGTKQRVEVKYQARPALMSADIPVRLPPFFELLTYVLQQVPKRTKLTTQSSSKIY